MRKLLNWLFGWPLIRSKPECYVIVCDSVDHTGETCLEEYYGYFSSPEEAREMWLTYAGPGIDTGFTNVKLCRVVEDWS